MNPYNSPEFKALRAEWNKKLKRVGFEDQEDEKGRLKHKDSRTISFQNREQISEFFSKIGEFLGGNSDIPKMHRRVLDLYCQGTWIVNISKQIKQPKHVITKIISYYKGLVFGCFP